MLNSFRIRSWIRTVQASWATLERRHRREVQVGARALAIVLALTTGFGAWYVASLWRGLPSSEAVATLGDMDQATSVFDHNDHIAFTIFTEQRIVVPLSEMSPQLIQAVVAIEDQHFYEHHGFDPVRIVSAALHNLRSGRVVQGGSTITQQLARQSFLTNERTWKRKIQEFILARRIERRYSKDRILELYLNKIYLGNGLYGAETAARDYFGKHARELTLDEAALIAGLIQSPSRYSPTSSPARAQGRRNVVLQAMVRTGAIDQDTMERARQMPVTTVDGLHAGQPFAEYFKEQVRIALVQQFGSDRVYHEGLRVYSTIDVDMQRAAEDAVASSLERLDKRIASRASAQAPKPSPAPLQAALIALDPATGDVRAMVGGRNFADSHFNRAVQARRQPGSAFKPLVYAAALEAGYSPASIIDHLNDPIDTIQGAWTPEEGHEGADAITVRAALRTSSNRAAVRVLENVGIPRVVASARALGVGTVPPVPSLALGSGEVTLQSLTAAYSAFANGGVVSQPRLIRRIEDRNGAVLFTAPSVSARAISEPTAFLMASMLADVVNAGTGAGVRARGFTLPAGGKTGTTNDFHDAWFVGFTPALVAGVWVGFDQPKTILANGFAAELAVPLWTSFMKDATKDDRPAWFSPPPGIVSARVCRISGKLATDKCDDNYVEYLALGTQPGETCDVHRPHSIMGLLAGLFHETPAAPRMAETAPLPALVAAVPTLEAPAAIDSTPAPSEPAPAPAKKRGFWSRIFKADGTNNDRQKR